MGIEFTNYSADKTIVVEIVESTLRELGRYPLRPKGSFTVQPGEKGVILDWIGKPVSFAHEATSAHVDIGQPRMGAAGLDGSRRSLTKFLHSRSKTIRDLHIKFTPVIK